MNPTGGLGGIHAIHDAVALANWMSTLRLADEEKLGKVFKKYRSERYPVAKAAFETSQMFTHNLGKVLISLFRDTKNVPLMFEILNRHFLQISQHVRTCFRSLFVQ